MKYQPNASVEVNESPLSNKSETIAFEMLRDCNNLLNLVAGCELLMILSQ